MVSSPWLMGGLIDVILHKSVVLGGGGPSCPQVQRYWLDGVGSKVINEEAVVQSGQASLPVAHLLVRTGYQCPVTIK